jgi:hypothetical protein
LKGHDSNPGGRGVITGDKVAEVAAKAAGTMRTTLASIVEPVFGPKVDLVEPEATEAAAESDSPNRKGRFDY